MVELSICIPTFNRASFLAQALQNVISQLTDQCEVVVVDNASTDDTEAVVASHARLCPGLRYFRNASNIGLDRNFDRAIECATGTYCWLLSDDDVIKPGAIERVLRALESKPSLVAMNAEVRDFSLSNVIRSRALSVKDDRVYPPGAVDRLFVDLAEDGHVCHVGMIIIKRDMWLGRERARYYDSFYVYVGVIFQRELPDNALFICEPLLSMRIGNSNSWHPHREEMLLRKWPATIASLAISATTRRAVTGCEPWRQYRWLLHLRGLDIYSRAGYKQWIRPRLNSLALRVIPALVSLMPIMFANRVMATYFALRKRNELNLYGLKSYAASVRTAQGGRTS